MGNKKHTTAGDLTNDTHLNFRIIICATLAAFAKPACFEPELITFLLVLPDKLSFADLSDTSRPDPEVPPPPQTLGDGSGSSSRTAEVGLYFAWATSFFTLCPRRLFSSPHHPFIVGTSGWRTLGKNFIPWDCRKGYFSGAAEKGS